MFELSTQTKIEPSRLYFGLVARTAYCVITTKEQAYYVNASHRTDISSTQLENKVNTPRRHCGKRFHSDGCN